MLRLRRTVFRTTGGVRSVLGSVHTPIVQRIPGVRNIRFGRVLATVDGDPPPYYLVSDVYFDDKASFEAALDSPQMKEAIADVPNFATGGVKIMFCEYEDFAPIVDPSA